MTKRMLGLRSPRFWSGAAAQRTPHRSATPSVEVQAAAARLTTPAQALISPISSAPIAPTRATISGTAYTVSGSATSSTIRYDLTLSSNVTLTLTSGQDGQHTVLHVCQDANGTRTLARTASGASLGWLLSGSQPTLSTGANVCDLFGFIYLNGVWYEDAYEPNAAPNYVIANSTATLSALVLSSPLDWAAEAPGQPPPPRSPHSRRATALRRG
jgi:hypothetical protein